MHTLAKPVTTLAADLFRGVSVDAVANMFAKVALDNALRVGLLPARKYLHTALVDVVRAYRAVSGSGGGGAPGGMALRPPGGPPGPGGAAPVVDLATMLPESLQVGGGGCAQVNALVHGS